MKTRANKPELHRMNIRKRLDTRNSDNVCNLLSNASSDSRMTPIRGHDQRTRALRREQKEDNRRTTCGHSVRPGGNKQQRDGEENKKIAGGHTHTATRGHSQRTTGRQETGNRQEEDKRDNTRAKFLPRPTEGHQEGKLRIARNSPTGQLEDNRGRLIQGNSHQE